MRSGVCVRWKMGTFYIHLVSLREYLQINGQNTLPDLAVSANLIWCIQFDKLYIHISIWQCFLTLALYHEYVGFLSRLKFPLSFINARIDVHQWKRASMEISRASMEISNLKVNVLKIFGGKAIRSYSWSAYKNWQKRPDPVKKCGRHILTVYLLNDSVVK